MTDNNLDKLYQILDAFEKAGKDKKEIRKIRTVLSKGKISEALEKIRQLNNAKDEQNLKTTYRKRKKAKNEDDEIEHNETNEENKEKLEADEEENENAEDYYEEDRKYNNLENDFDDEAKYDTKTTELDEYEEEQENSENSNYDENYDNENYKEDDELYGWNNEENIVYKEETKKQESIYPEKLRDENLEKTYIGMLLNNPKLISKYYILFEECYFDDQSLLNIYKSILFTEGGKYTPEIAKKGFSFSVDNNETYKQIALSQLSEDELNGKGGK